MTGNELVEQKVKLLSLMAGAFQPIDGNHHYLEYNVVKDIASAQTLAERWPTAMVYSGFEIGIALPYPAISIERDYGYVPHHPLAEAYIRRNPPPHNRPTWDLTSVLDAVLGDRGYFDVSPRRDGDRRARRLHAIRAEPPGKPQLPDPPARAEAARARGLGAAFQPALEREGE